MAAKRKKAKNSKKAKKARAKPKGRAKKVAFDEAETQQLSTVEVVTEIEISNVLDQLSPSPPQRRGPG
ncbi:MAG: hypothetical protein U0228_31305 [Myxococcaceae bacterium]